MIYFALHLLFQFCMAGIAIKNWINRISQLDLCLLKLDLRFFVEIGSDDAKSYL